MLTIHNAMDDIAECLSKSNRTGLPHTSQEIVPVLFWILSLLSQLILTRLNWTLSIVMVKV